MRLRMMIGTGVAVAAIVAWLTAWLTLPVSIITVRHDEPPYNFTATTSLGTSCTAPCYLHIYTKDDFDLTLSAPGYLDRTVRMSIPRYRDGSYSEYPHQPELSKIPLLKAPDKKP
jgi:hypothetical protein